MAAKPLPIFIDTNILIRFVLQSAPLHHEIRKAIGDLWQEGHELWISRQVIRELAVVITRPQTYAKTFSSIAAAREIRSLSASFYIADETLSVTEKLLDLMEHVPMGGKNIHDANIVATMLTHGIGRLLTLNPADFARFPQHITVITPEELLKRAK